MRVLVNLWRWALSLFVRLRLWEQEHYIRDAERTGVHTSLDMRAFKAERDAMRIRLIDLLPSPVNAARAKGARKPQDDAIQPAGAETDGAGIEQPVEA